MVTEFSWSLDGIEWKPVADNLSLKIEFLRPLDHWTNEAAEFVRTEVLGDLDEPLGHELLREAAVNRKNNLRSSLVLAVVAAEVGFKQFASKAFPGTDWILEKLPSPPLVTMLQVFPWSKLGVRINGKVPSIPGPIESELKKAANLRNQIVHTGVVKLKGETVDSALTSVRDLLYFLDALGGQNWAVNHMSPDAVNHFPNAKNFSNGCAPGLLNMRPRLTRALDLSLQHHLSLWDYVYLALAIEHDCPFLTADRRLFRGATARHPSLRLLQ